MLSASIAAGARSEEGPKAGARRGHEVLELSSFEASAEAGTAQH